MSAWRCAIYSEDLIIFTLLNIVIVLSLTLFADVISWGFTTMADCLAVNFDPVCYSESENQPIETDDPMWWPHD